jgi:hypothetical protein
MLALGQSGESTLEALVYLPSVLQQHLSMALFASMQYCLLFFCMQQHSSTVLSVRVQRIVPFPVLGQQVPFQLEASFQA